MRRRGGDQRHGRGPDDDNPEVQNPKFWTLTEEGYVVAANSTAVEAIDDLWTVHQDDGVPVPRIWCYKYALLIMARAYVQHFHNTHSDAGLAAMNSLIGHNVIPGGVPNGARACSGRRGAAMPISCPATRCGSRTRTSPAGGN